ncbi:FAD-binding oxidoreductase [Psychromarinibacter sp. C21-152]|uniref:FAD-binding oxidoreductase n=1 Tax=Psychromarinibacter sediminicola TaxID=3033385 RepID=A0AAE3T9T7_9RHOB|nr:FAD-binding oxidoreductase [Psychromarinibacter sediminicola]MDF0602975.1 FAD-binding oxidoreductase [Psychromarinibacter sediminicola]
MAMADVTVMGAGIFGLSVAYACARRGARVRVLDRRGVAAGSSGGVVGALAPHVPENWNPKKAFQLDSLLMAGSFWAEVDALSGGASGYARLGRLQPLADERAVELARGREDTARELWGAAAEWRVIGAAEAGDWRPESATGLYVRDTLTARMRPRAACESLAGAVRALGGEVAVGAEAPGGPVVWATGYEGLADLSAALGRSVGTGVKGQAVSLRLEAADRPQLFADGLHVVPHADGTVAVGSTSEREFDDPGAVDAQADDLVARARAVCQALEGAEVVARWAGVRPRAKSRAPMLGAWPDRPGHFIANGGFKIGFGMAPKVGEVMADLVLEGRDAVPEGFRVSDNL